MDGKITQPFLFPFFITENGSVSGIVGYENGNGGYGNRREPENLP